jgi:hypothetical protein
MLAPASVCVFGWGGEGAKTKNALKLSELSDSVTNARAHVCSGCGGGCLTVLHKGGNRRSLAGSRMVGQLYRELEYTEGTFEVCCLRYMLPSHSVPILTCSFPWFSDASPSTSRTQDALEAELEIARSKKKAGKVCRNGQWMHHEFNRQRDCLIWIIPTPLPDLIVLGWKPERDRIHSFCHVKCIQF